MANKEIETWFKLPNGERVLRLRVEDNDGKPLFEVSAAGVAELSRRVEQLIDMEQRERHWRERLQGTLKRLFDAVSDELGRFR